MPRYFFRSTLFNLCFYILTAVSCVLLLPTLFLPRRVFLSVVYVFVFFTSVLEKYILGLDFEVRGLANLPKDGSYIVAAKHQSAYETTKLHILFGDPAIVLKKELLKIPLWGMYLAKSDVIAIDRSSPKAAIESITNGAIRMKMQGRPIVIFPQGTRVSPEITSLQRPYKIGVVRIQEATDLPLIPLALNTGMFWPRNSWIKKPGKVIFEFLPPIPPGLPANQVLKDLENSLETTTNALMDEARNTPKKRKKFSGITYVLLSLLVISYSVWWHFIANNIQKAYLDTLNNLQDQFHLNITEKSSPMISGFPFEITLTLAPHRFESADGFMRIESLYAYSYPFSGMPITLHAENITFRHRDWPNDMVVDSLDAKFTLWNDLVSISSSLIKKEEFLGTITGTVNFNSALSFPEIDLMFILKNSAELFPELIKNKIISREHGSALAIGLRAIERDGVASIKLITQNNALYLGPFRLMSLPHNKKTIIENGEIDKKT